MAGGTDSSRTVLPWPLLLATLVALLDLGGRSLNDMDVPRSAGLAREMVDTGHWIVPTRAGETYANKPPLDVWLVAVSGASAFALLRYRFRLPERWPSCSASRRCTPPRRLCSRCRRSTPRTW